MVRSINRKNSKNSKGWGRNCHLLARRW